MTDETKKNKERPIIDMIFRLINVYLAATFFFNGWENWQSEKYLLAVTMLRTELREDSGVVS